MTTDTNNPTPIAEYACTWRTPDRTGMRYPEQSDLSGGATDCAPAPAVDERAEDSGHLAAAPKQQLPEPVARLLRWCGPSYMQVPHDGLAARTFAEFPLKESTSAHAYWKDGALLYTADQLHAAIAAERERNPWRMVMDDALVTAHLGVATDDPYDDLNRLLDWHHDIWLDPAVSSDAQALIDRGAAASEAELCTLRQQLAEAVRDGWSDADADAARLALELECLLTDKDVPMPALSRWWDSAHEALELHRARFRTAIAAQWEAKPPGVERELFEGE